MQIKDSARWFGAGLVLILAGCGPVGPALGPVLGLGPVLDPLVGLALLVALVLAGVWVVKSAVRSRAGQAVERQFSETEQAVRDRCRAGSDNRDAKHRREGDVTSRAEEVLRERYARGEIDRKQYLEILDDLKHR